MGYNQDEEIPVTGIVDPRQLGEPVQFTKDEEEQSTLRRVYVILREKMADIDKWHAFERKTDSELSIKQQIKARQIAFEIVAPAFEAVEQALATVDEKFRQRNNK